MCLPPCVVSNTSQRMPTSTTEQLIKGGHAWYFQNIQDFVFYLFYLYFKIFDAIFFSFSRNTRDQSKCYSEMLWGTVSLFPFSRLWRTAQRELVQIWTWGSIKVFDKHLLTWIAFSEPSGILSKLLELVPCDSQSILALKSDPVIPAFL